MTGDVSEHGSEPNHSSQHSPSEIFDYLKILLLGMSVVILAGVFGVIIYILL